MKIDAMGAMTGMPVGRKKTRRGPRKSKNAGVSKNPHDHLKNLQGALAADDHHAARKSAFHLIRALRPPTAGAAGSASEEAGEDPMLDTPEEEAGETALPTAPKMPGKMVAPTMPKMPGQPGVSGPAKASRLAMAALAMRKKAKA